MYISSVSYRAFLPCSNIRSLLCYPLPLLCYPLPPPVADVCLLFIKNFDLGPKVTRGGKVARISLLLE